MRTNDEKNQLKLRVHQRRKRKGRRARTCDPLDDDNKY
jgi:hypothetical protein